MSNRKKLWTPSSKEGATAPARVNKYQIRIHAENPTIDYSEILLNGIGAVERRIYELARRTSYQVNGTNIWVWWAIDEWVANTQSWSCVMNGKTRLKEGAGPERGDGLGWQDLPPESRILDKGLKRG